MNCLCCGKPLPAAPKPEEMESGWHKRCIKSFFGTARLPELAPDREALELLTLRTVKKGLTVPGVQKKLSLHLSRSGGASRLTIVDYPTGYILKPPSEEFGSLPEYEHTAMLLAERAGIRTVPHGLMKQGEGFAYITRRIDREMRKEGPALLAMEDFCQLGRRLTRDKYRGSYEQCAKTLRNYSAMPNLDLSELFIRVVFSWLIGNSDMHLKNFSLIEQEPGSRVFGLSKAYDMLPVNLIMPEDTEELALTLNGKKRNLHRNDFLLFAEICGLPKAAGEKIIRRLCGMEAAFLQIIGDSPLEAEQKEGLSRLLQSRISRIQPQ